MSDNSILVIKGALKDYAWGKVNGLQNWVAKTDQPQAELWFGDHPSGKSINKNNGKDEMLFALEEFQAFAGVESKAKRDVVFKMLFEKTNAKELQEVLATDTFFDAADIIFEIDKTKISQINKEVVDCVKKANYPAKAISTFEKIVIKYPNDPGVLVCLLMQFHVLEKGHAIHVSPGTPHSYVQGLAVEVMTTSDNVLRMGLTNKYVNIDAALSLVEEKQIQVLSLPTNDGVHVYHAVVARTV